MDWSHANLAVTLPSVPADGKVYVFFNQRGLYDDDNVLFVGDRQPAKRDLGDSAEESGLEIREQVWNSRMWEIAG